MMDSLLRVHQMKMHPCNKRTTRREETFPLDSNRPMVENGNNTKTAPVAPGGHSQRRKNQMGITDTDKEILKRAIRGFSSLRVLIIGDIIIDHFIWGTVERISPEAPVPVVNVTRENLLLGGAANVLNNIKALGGEAEICGVVGDDVMGDHLLGMLEKLKIPADGVFRVSGRPTTKKTRIIAQSQQVVRVDREETSPFPADLVPGFKDYLEKKIHDVDAVVVSDYNKGMITAGVMDIVRETVRKHKAVPVICDPKPEDIQRFAGVTLITPNNHEAELMSGVRIRTLEDLDRAAAAIMGRLAPRALLITRGEAGMALYDDSGEVMTIPTQAREVYDVTGAGDTVIATIGLALAGGLSFAQASILANHAAGIVVGKVGTATASNAELMEKIQ